MKQKPRKNQASPAYHLPARYTSFCTLHAQAACRTLQEVLWHAVFPLACQKQCMDMPTSERSRIRALYFSLKQPTMIVICKLETTRFIQPRLENDHDVIDQNCTIQTQIGHKTAKPYFRQNLSLLTLVWECPWEHSFISRAPLFVILCYD